MAKYTDIIKKIASHISYEKACVCAMDIFNGLDDNTVEQRYDAWMNYLIGNEKGFPVFETKRNGLVVPFYPLLINQKKEK